MIGGKMFQSAPCAAVPAGLEDTQTPVNKYQITPCEMCGMEVNCVTVEAVRPNPHPCYLPIKSKIKLCLRCNDILYNAYK